MATVLINQTKKVILPNGTKKQVNIFDYNLAFCADAYVQLTDTSWIKARSLKQLDS